MPQEKKGARSLDDARGYLEEYFVPVMYSVPDEGPGSVKCADIFHDIFNSGEVKGKRLIDVGCGPVLSQLISASRFFSEIVCAEYSESGRAEIEKWVAEDPDAFDWSGYVQYFCDMEGTRDIWKERQKQLRQAIKAVIPCDIHKPNPIEPLQMEPFDVVITLYCLEAACSDRESYTKAVRNVSTLLKSGGTLILQTYIGASFYTVGDVSHPIVKLDVDFVLQTISDAGYDDVKCSYYASPKRERDTTSDVTALLHLTAKKMKILLRVKMSTEEEKYDDSFNNPREYLDYFYSDLTGAKCPDEGEWMPWSMEQFHRTFSQGKGFGTRLLDIGSGPTVYQLVSASRIFPEIVCSDFHKGALEEIKKWKDGNTHAFDWSPFVKHVAGLEGTSWESRQDQLRSAIKDVVPCDVFNPNPLHPGMFEPFDAIISAYCLDAACYKLGRSARSVYAQTLRNISTLLKPGGHLILQTYIGATYWLDDKGNKTPDSLCLDTDFVLKTLSEVGFTDLETSEYKTPEREKCYFSDIKAMLHVTGKKI